MYHQAYMFPQPALRLMPVGTSWTIVLLICVTEHVYAGFVIHIGHGHVPVPVLTWVVNASCKPTGMEWEGQPSEQLALKLFIDRSCNHGSCLVNGTGCYSWPRRHYSNMTGCYSWLSRHHSNVTGMFLIRNKKILTSSSPFRSCEHPVLPSFGNGRSQWAIFLNFAYLNRQLLSTYCRTHLIFKCRSTIST